MGLHHPFPKRIKIKTNKITPLRKQATFYSQKQIENSATTSNMSKLTVIWHSKNCRLKSIHFEILLIKFTIAMENPAHFQTVLESESQRLNALCTKWQEILETSLNLTDELSGQILSAVGKFL